MTAKLKLSSNWDKCPRAWQNFADEIHTRHPYVPESVFWVIAHSSLRDLFDARLIASSEHPSCIEFKNDKDLTWFLLRWS
jgi:hypothetical protein